VKIQLSVCLSLKEVLQPHLSLWAEDLDNQAKTTHRARALYITDSSNFAAKKKEVQGRYGQGEHEEKSSILQPCAEVHSAADLRG